MSNNNEIFMTENKSNKASIIVAVLAICLILGGVYLLNQSFTSSNKTTETVKTSTVTPKTETTTSTTKTSSTATPTTSNSTTASPTTSTTPTTTSSSQTSTTPATSTTTPTTSTSTGTTNPITTPAPATTTKPTLTEKQIIAKALSVSSSGEVRFEIQECGLPNARVCKSGTKFTLTGVKAIAEKVYLVSGNISESNGTLSLENITIKENI